MAKPITLPLPEARAIALRAQGLAEDAAPFGLGQAGTLAALEHLGYVQVDTIHVLERAHHHVLWSRVPDYRPEFLHALQAEGTAFEYWNHAASYLPTSGYRYSRRLMQKYRAHPHWAQDTPELRQSMRRMLTDEKTIAANALYEACLTIQNAARLQYPEKKDAQGNAQNVTERARFLVDEFPPRDRSEPDGGTQSAATGTPPAA